MDIIFGEGFTGSGGFNIAMLALAVTLASSQSTRLHVWGTVVAWAIFLTSVALRGLGVIV